MFNMYVCVCVCVCVGNHVRALRLSEKISSQEEIFQGFFQFSSFCYNPVHQTAPKTVQKTAQNTKHARAFLAPLQDKICQKQNFEGSYFFPKM